MASYDTKYERVHSIEYVIHIQLGFEPYINWIKNRSVTSYYTRIHQRYCSFLKRIFNKIDGPVFTSIRNDYNDLILTLNAFIGSGDLIKLFIELYLFVSNVNVFEITAFHIQTDVTWDLSILSLKQCKEKDILYLLIHLLLQPSMHTLRPSQSQIIEHFVRNRINGIVLDSMNEKAFMESWHTSLKIKLYKIKLRRTRHRVSDCLLFNFYSTPCKQ
eukprot:548773_1